MEIPDANTGLARRRKPAGCSNDWESQSSGCGGTSMPHKNRGGVQTWSSKSSWRLLGYNGLGELEQAASGSASGKSALK